MSILYYSIILFYYYIIISIYRYCIGLAVYSGLLTSIRLYWSKPPQAFAFALRLRLRSAAMLPTLSIPSLALVLVLADASNPSAPYITVATYVLYILLFSLHTQLYTLLLPYVVWYFVTCYECLMTLTYPFPGSVFSVYILSGMYICRLFPPRCFVFALAFNLVLTSLRVSMKKGAPCRRQRASPFSTLLLTAPPWRRRGRRNFVRLLAFFFAVSFFSLVSLVLRCLRGCGCFPFSSLSLHTLPPRCNCDV